MCFLPAHMGLMKMSGSSLKLSPVTMILADLMDELIGSAVFFDLDLATRPYSHGTKLAVYLVSGMELPDIQQSSFISLKMCRHMTVQPWNGAIPMETSLAVSIRLDVCLSLMSLFAVCLSQLLEWPHQTSGSDLHNIVSGWNEIKSKRRKAFSPYIHRYNQIFYGM